MQPSVKEYAKKQGHLPVRTGLQITAVFLDVQSTTQNKLGIPLQSSWENCNSVWTMLCLNVLDSMQFYQKTALWAITAIRWGFDKVTGYPNRMTENRWLLRIVFLETVAGTVHTITWFSLKTLDSSTCIQLGAQMVCTLHASLSECC